MNHHMLTDFTSSSNSLDPRGPLAELARRASGFCLNLDELVFEDNCDLSRGGNAMVHSGDLYQKEDAAGTFGDCHPRDRKSTKVNYRMKDHGTQSL